MKEIQEQVVKTFRIPTELNTRLELQSERMGVPQGYLIRRSLEHFLSQNERAYEKITHPIMGSLYRHLITWAAKGVEPERAAELIAIVEKIEQDIAKSQRMGEKSNEPA